MQKAIEVQAQAPAGDLLVPLQVDYGTQVPNDFTLPEGLTLDEGRQITVMGGEAVIESELSAHMGITKSNAVSDGQQGALDQNVPDDATPNA
ncbi:hypothetical protein [Embleya sp. NPDC005971]|uniref:hypothetical protein n=1 Tax=unclassified Embleya TaxID=2699296 RepID=UPI0033D3566E